uniref:Uncharacterized protein n=1 Tax=Anguilla anguilla TaxID=7936 RepID=A0A0E9UQ72_ANGAN
MSNGKLKGQVNQGLQISAPPHCRKRDENYLDATYFRLF